MAPLKPLHYIYVVLLLVLGGSSFIAVKYVLAALPPMYFSALRMALVAFLILPWAGKTSVPPRQLMLMAFLSAVVNMAGNSLSMKMGLDVASAVVVQQFGVPFACLFGAVILQDRLGLWRSAGLLFAVLGVYILSGAPNIVANPLAFTVGMVSAAGWGLTTIFMKRMGHIEIMPYIGWFSLFGAVQLFGLSYFMESGQWESTLNMDAKVWCCFLYLTLGVLIAAQAIWYYLLRHYQASQLTPYTLLQPFVAFGFGILFLDEHITREVLLAGLISVFGVIIIVMRRPRLGLFDKLFPARFITPETRKNGE